MHAHVCRTAAAQLDRMRCRWPYVATVALLCICFCCFGSLRARCIRMPTKAFLVLLHGAVGSHSFEPTPWGCGYCTYPQQPGHKCSVQNTILRHWWFGGGGIVYCSTSALAHRSAVARLGGYCNNSFLSATLAQHLQLLAMHGVFWGGEPSQSHCINTA